MTSIVYIILAVVLVAIAIIVVVWPLLQARTAAGRKAGGANPESQLAELIARRDTIYRTIREIEFDYRTGKMSEADYRSVDAQLKAQAVAVLQQLDRVNATMPDLDAEIEQEVAALRRAKPATTAPEAQTALPPVEPVAPAPVAETLTCPQCGQALPKNARFCLHCGQALTVGDAQPAVKS